MFLSENIPFQLPQGWYGELVAFSRNDNMSSSDILYLPRPLNMKAIVIPQERSSEFSNILTVLNIPVKTPTDEKQLANIQQWVGQNNHDDSDTANVTQPQLIALHQVQVIWSPLRMAILASPERIETAKKSMIEVSYYVLELYRIEQEINELWPHLEADTAKAFEFNALAALRKKELADRFYKVVALRAKLAQLSPFLLSPHVYPPTMTSQLSERLRERLRVHEKVEFVSDQIEVFENIYTMCAERASEYQHARNSNTLEWLIIILLAAEVFLLTFEYLVATGS